MSDAITRLNEALEGRYRIEREVGAGGMATDDRRFLMLLLDDDSAIGDEIRMIQNLPELLQRLTPS